MRRTWGRRERPAGDELDVDGGARDHEHVGRIDDCGARRRWPRGNRRPRGVGGGRHVRGGDRLGTLEDDSKILHGQRLESLPDGGWYGVEGVVRDGRPLGGVMMHGHGYDREPDGTFPVVDAWHVNLQTLELEPTSIEGLDIVESCG